MVSNPVERRSQPRVAVRAASRLVHDASGRGFPCQCTEISAGGARLAAPATMPVRPGHTVRLSGVAAATDGIADLGDGDLTAVVVRVDREALFTAGHIVLAVRFVRP